MASEEQKRLASFIKATHNQLRKESRIYGPREAWERHLARTEVLQNYATSMRELATKHWSEQTHESHEENRCRNKWIVSRCSEYFFSAGKEIFEFREAEIAAKMRIARNTEEISDEAKNFPSFLESEKDNSADSEEKIKLLDVGSCYNPLGKEKMFRVTPIDIAPCSDETLRCDFLNVELGSTTIYSQDGKSVERLEQASFDAVVFSLLLEYFPCPEQRFRCCSRAYDLLKSGGILIIVTPDSNHIGVNAKIMKSWRYVLSRLGYSRIKYEKLTHLHCLVFRKCADKAVAARWSQVHEPTKKDMDLCSQDKIYIRQDFSRTEKNPRKTIPGIDVKHDRQELASVFEEMPCSL